MPTNPTRMPTFPPRARWACLLWLVLLPALAPEAAAQFLSDPSASLEQQALAAQQARRQAMDRLRLGGPLALEGAVDAEAYIVGPGDVFIVAVGGALSTETQAVVSADGLLVVPEVGGFPVAGLTLVEARTRVQAGLRRIYRNVATEVALVQPRQFFVHVSGAVERPGRHVMVPIARVEDAVAAGMDDHSPLLVRQFRLRRDGLRREGLRLDPEAPLPALRNVEVRRRDGSTERVDLLRYYATGDPAHNPYLQDGDAVYVPTLDRRSADVVYVEREDRDPAAPAPPAPEPLDLRPDDTVTALLMVAGGTALLERSGRVRLLRADAQGGVRTEEVDVAAIRARETPDPALLPGDRLLVVAPATRRGGATVAGYVRFPGTYPVVEGETTLRELVAAAGGVRPDGLLRGAYLERPDPTLPGPGELPGGEVRAALTDLPPDPTFQRLLLAQAAFQGTRLSDLGFGSRLYFARELQQFQRVSLALGDDPSALPEVPLRDGDRFVVPRDPHAVLVLGQVRSPGYIPFARGAGAEHYVEQAGGRGPAGTETYVREAGTGYFRPAGMAPPRSGDVVFVDRALIADTEELQQLALQERQQELFREQDRRNARFQLVQTTLSVVSTSIAVITTYLFIRDRG